MLSITPKKRAKISASLLLTLVMLLGTFATYGLAGAQATTPTPAPPATAAPSATPNPALGEAAPGDVLSYVTDIFPQRERNLMVMHTDGSGMKQLTSGFNVYFAAWSPDGKRLAVTTEGAELYTVNADGTGLKRLAGDAYSQPSWSPDGHFIAYVGGEHFAMPVAKGNLRIISAGGGVPWIVPGGEDIPSLPPGASAFVWSPDGTKIACGQPARILEVANGPNGGVPVEQFKGDMSKMFIVAGGWAPDNKHFAMTDGTRYGILDNTNGDFVTIATSYPQTGGGIARPGVSWSAGIGKVAYDINSDAQDGQRLFLANLDGTDPKLILSAPHLAHYNGEVSDYGPPNFSSDSKTMFLRVSRTFPQGSGVVYKHESWIVNTDGSGGQKLLDGFNANWQPKTKLKLPDAAFWFAWRTTDLAVANNQTARPYLWGPTPIFSGTEALATAEDIHSAKPVTDLTRLQVQVVYFDKGRMELHDPNPSQPTPYLVIGGALSKELVTGQIDDDASPSDYDTRSPASILVAGDNPAADAPTYATFNKLGAGADAGKVVDQTGQPITAVLAKDGTVRQDSGLGGQAKNAMFIVATGHNIADAFMNYFNGQPWSWTRIAGLPISEPYWVHTEVAGQPRTILVQIFERRTVTYDPAEPLAQYKVQFGNVGQQYYNWRYGGK